MTAWIFGRWSESMMTGRMPLGVIHLDAAASEKSRRNSDLCSLPKAETLSRTSIPWHRLGRSGA